MQGGLPKGHQHGAASHKLRLQRAVVLLAPAAAEHATVRAGCSKPCCVPWHLATQLRAVCALPAAWGRFLVPPTPPAAAADPAHQENTFSASAHFHAAGTCEGRQQAEREILLCSTQVRQCAPPAPSCGACCCSGGRPSRLARHEPLKPPALTGPLPVSSCTHTCCWKRVAVMTIGRPMNSPQVSPATGSSVM